MAPVSFFPPDSGRFSLRNNGNVWEIENPKVEIEKEVNSPGLTVWGGIYSGGIFGPYIFDAKAYGENYFKRLEKFMQPNLVVKTFTS
ncbi:hypothetical protein LAZ67_2003465 [Cordylochernes scorpioides]|uniref:Uncharacterized protein n=1 Tax=Cordylochernes scorpioides TaxID=51811 RepID=A0ABY6K3N8_9ARAC|nr:hypothetical protein LAZ67_2003465 [Cordylochernes scorpioides]